jgi:hypothetical protein
MFFISEKPKNVQIFQITRVFRVILGVFFVLDVRRAHGVIRQPHSGFNSHISGTRFVSNFGTAKRAHQLRGMCSSVGSGLWREY